MKGAIDRIQDFDPRFLEEGVEPNLDNDNLAKAQARAAKIRQVFMGPAGREVLDYMIGAYLIGKHEGLTAERALGREDVVKDILTQFHLAEELDNERTRAISTQSNGDAFN